MSLSTGSQAGSSFGLKARLPTLIAPVAALLYPFTLVGFHASVVTATAANASNGVALPGLAAAVALLLAFAIPTIALLAAMSFAEIRQPTAAQLRAKRAALLAVAAPTLFTFIGVLLYMLHDPVSDVGFWVACWVIPLVMLFFADNETPASSKVQPVPMYVRVAHGMSALAIIAIFLVLHIANHFTGLLGPTTYDAVMKIFRHVYRSEIVQPVLIALFFFQIGTGLYLAWLHTAAPSDRFRTFQIASGVYLVFYILGHMDSVFIFARTYLGVDTGWTFATGAPTGLIKDAWNIRLVPHYWFGVFFVLSHIATGSRAVMMSHGVHKMFADRLMVGGTIAAGAIATAIMLGMCGVRIWFI